MWDPDKYLAAWRFATAAHLGQTVPRSDLPYVLHIGAVAMETTAALANEPVDDADLAVQCALLHDVVEDTATTAEDLAARFGPAVAEGVLALTKNAALAKSEAMRDSLHRIRQQPHEIWLVKMADRITNLQPPPAHWAADKCRRYHAEAGTILDALGAGHGYLAARLRRKIVTYAGYID